MLFHILGIRESFLGVVVAHIGDYDTDFDVFSIIAFAGNIDHIDHRYMVFGQYESACVIQDAVLISMHTDINHICNISHLREFYCEAVKGLFYRTRF